MVPASGGPKKMLHVVIGTPDPDNCPICRAHAQAAGGPVTDGEHGPIRIEELSLGDILRCSCPLCVEARQADQED
jgi:hypothetical protein